MSIKYSSNDDHVYYPSTSVPVNKMCIMDEDTLVKLESDLILRAYEHFHIRMQEWTLFSEDFLIELHRFAFNKLYDWAWKYRTVNISKWNSVFCQVAHLQGYSKEIFHKLEKDNYLRDYSDKSKEKLAERISYYMCELIALHPFSEWNWRIIRLFFDMICIYNWYEYIDYSWINFNWKNNDYITASIACMSWDCNLMRDIILKWLKKWM